MVKGRPTSLLLSLALTLGFAPPARASELSDLVARGLLAPEYPGLSPAWLAVPGPHSHDYANPEAMLAAARYADAHPDFARLITTMRRGDVLFSTNNNPREAVAYLTNGPFGHVLLCVDATPPCRFIEAIGVTADLGDPSSDRVRFTSLARYAHDGMTFRRTRPAAQLPVAKQAPAIEAAIAFATAQLGKPYNYAFSDRLGGTRAFYCSSLILAAYQAGGVPYPLVKDPARDRLIVALKRVVLALGPDDPVALSSHVMAFMHHLPRRTPTELSGFVVTEVLPHLRETAPLVRTRERRERLAAALASVLEGRALPHAQALQANKQKLDALLVSASSRGALGSYSRQLMPSFTTRGLDAAALRMAAVERTAIAIDTLAIARQCGLHEPATLGLAGVLVDAALPYADTLALCFTGPDSSQTRAMKGMLDALDRSRSVVKVPLASFSGRAPWVIDLDFASPTDMAWGPLPHEDFNVLPAEPIDPPWSHTRVIGRHRPGR